ncbi:MAG: 3-phosphoshikimate 1-carboxyvinyltransferase [Oscillospiraceae bacterium]|nr:3-phosphoshikimate 1-carboxyvinyltransferase [Oscillospiraceae bacterium]
MNVICYPSALNGTVSAIPSKSDAHRKLICTALSGTGGMLPLFPPFCDDIAATVRCLESLGAGFSQSDEGLCVTPITARDRAELDCGESGSTLRFLLPVASAICNQVAVTGSGRLPERPISALTDAMSAHGVHFGGLKLPFTASGKLEGGKYEIPGNISSQFLSGLLMALPLCSVDSEIQLTTALQSSAYVDMTLRTLREFDAEIKVSTEKSGFPTYRVMHGVLSCPERLTIDGDWSNAAFWLAAGAIQKDKKASITVKGLSADSTQGDSLIWKILRDTGADVSHEFDAFTVKTARNYTADISMERIPDLLPILAVRAACTSEIDNWSNFVNAGRLRLKESDRLTATARLLESLGIDVREQPDSLSVHGGQIHGGIVDGVNDHRIVMAAAIAAISADSPVKILGAEAVNKSYPTFFEDYRSLGGKCVFEGND